MITELSSRSREVFCRIVDLYMETGDPVGSRTLSKNLEEKLSPATIRNVMADLEDSGLLFAPHTSAGRIPTETGLKLYVDGLLEIGSLNEEETARINTQCEIAGRSLETVLADAIDTLSGLSCQAGIVVAPTIERPLRHIEFVPLAADRALVVTVSDNGLVENRVIQVPFGMSSSMLVEAGNYLTAKMNGKTLPEALATIEQDIADHHTQLDTLTQKVVEAGVATWTGNSSDNEGLLLVRGQSKLLEDVTNLVDLERIRSLFDALESKQNFLKLIELTEKGKGVQIFIGAENNLFNLSGCSIIFAPYHAAIAESPRTKVLGALGVVGPTRMNYSRIIPMVDHTARVVSQILGANDLKA